MVNAFKNVLVELYKKYSNICIVDSDNGGGYKDAVLAYDSSRYLNIGISECNAVGFASGLASCGYVPFVIAPGAFLAHRANEFIRDDVCLQNRNVKIFGVGAGFGLFAHGKTHYMTEDIASVRAFPNLKIITAASPKEASLITREVYKIAEPVYVRLGRYEGKDFYDKFNPKFEIGKGQILLEGNDISIISTGSIINDVLEANEEIKKNGINAEIINISTIKPLDENLILQSAQKCGRVLIVEEGSVYGGLFGAVAETFAKHGTNVFVDVVGLVDKLPYGYGNYKSIKKTNGLGVGNICEKAIMLARKRLL